MINNQTSKRAPQSLKSLAKQSIVCYWARFERVKSIILAVEACSSLAAQVFSSLAAKRLQGNASYCFLPKLFCLEVTAATLRGGSVVIQ